MHINQSAWKQLKWFALFLAVFFVLIAVVQYEYVQYQFQKSVKSQLTGWADALIDQIDLQDTWEF